MTHRSGKTGREDRQRSAAADKAAAELEAARGEREAGDAGDDGAERVADDLAALRAKADEYLETAQRVQAEFENYKKRMLRDQAHAIERAGERIVRELLPVIDDLDRTLAATRSEAAELKAEHLADAVRLVRENLLGVLAKEGVEIIDPAGEPFDPNYHEAMMQVEREDLVDCTVVEVCKRGYSMRDRLLRAAQVVVSCVPSDGEDPGSGYGPAGGSGDGA